MTHAIAVYSALCATSEFVINGIDADSNDFGYQGDSDRENADDYACGNMRFEPKAPDESVLQKYSIDELEYWTIANKLADSLSFGNCGWCV